MSDRHLYEDFAVSLWQSTLNLKDHRFEQVSERLGRSQRIGVAEARVSFVECLGSSRPRLRIIDGSESDCVFGSDEVLVPDVAR